MCSSRDAGALIRGSSLGSLDDANHWPIGEFRSELYAGRDTHETTSAELRACFGPLLCMSERFLARLVAGEIARRVILIVGLWRGCYSCVTAESCPEVCLLARGGPTASDGCWGLICMAKRAGHSHGHSHGHWE